MIAGSVEGFACGFHALMVPSEEAEITTLHCQHGERVRAGGPTGLIVVA